MKNAPLKADQDRERIWFSPHCVSTSSSIGLIKEARERLGLVLPDRNKDR